MMLYFDHLVDTREKRVRLATLIFLGVALLFLVPYILLGAYLIMTSSYASLYSLLALPVLHMCYLARVIVDAMSLTSVSIPTIVSILCQNIGWMELLLMGCFVLVANIVLKHKKATRCFCVLFMEAIVCLVLLNFALTSSSLTNAITYVRLVGGVFVASNALLMLVLGLSFMKEVKQYRKALAWSVEEIKEHRE